MREGALLRAGFPEAVVDSVVRLSRFDAGFPYLDHLRVVAASRDLLAIRVAMARLLRKGRAHGRRAPGTQDAAARERHREAMAIMRRGLGC